MASNGNQLPSTPAPDVGTSDHGQRRHRGERHQPRYTPNEQEARVLSECQRESFWYRALPIGLLSGTGVFMLIQKGILTTKSRFGPLPKVLFGGLCGYLLGKVTYVSTCKQKFLKLENSPIAEMIRKGASPGAIAASTGFGRPMDGFGTRESGDDAMFTGGSGGKVSDDYLADMDFDTSNQSQDVSLESYDQSHAADTAASEEAKVKRPEMTMTYDQLRKQNREKKSQQYREVLPGHYQQRNVPPSAERSTSVPSAGQRSDPDDGFTLGRSKKMRKNAYGDLISDE